MRREKEVKNKGGFKGSIIGEGMWQKKIEIGKGDQSRIEVDVFRYLEK
jgi:hypothetical protein